MHTNEIVVLRRAEMRLVEMGALADALLHSSISSEEIVNRLRAEFRIMVKTTRTVQGTVIHGSSSTNFISTIKWVREITRRLDSSTGLTLSVMDLHDAKVLVESWVGQESFEIPLDWDLTLWPLPAGFKVL